MPSARDGVAITGGYLGNKIAKGFSTRRPERLPGSQHWSAAGQWHDCPLARIASRYGIGALRVQAAPTVLPHCAKGHYGPRARGSRAAYGARKAFGEGYDEVLPALGGYSFMHCLTERSGEAVEKLAENPLPQQAVTRWQDARRPVSVQAGGWPVGSADTWAVARARKKAVMSSTNRVMVVAMRPNARKAYMRAQKATNK